mgnify:CR=1 FL=1
MEENYYDILEVNKNASPEIIEKAYKTLVKKYHPDLQENNLKENYEEKLKKINEAYEILSNPEKRKNYDLNLKNIEFSKDDYNNLINENINLKNEINYLKNTIKDYNNNFNNFENNINYTKKTNINNNYENNNKSDYNINTQNLKNIKYYFENNLQKIFKNFLALILTIIFFIIIGFILCNIPFTKNYLINLYNTNFTLKFIIDLFFNIFK